MRPYNFPLNNPQTVQTGGGPLSWLLQPLPLTRDKRPAHLMALVLTFTLAVISAAGAAALPAPSLYRLVQQLVINRNGNLQRVNLMSGSQARAWNALMNGGIKREHLPANVPANGGGAPLTTPVTFDVAFWFHAPVLDDPYTFVRPTGNYKGGQIQIVTGNPTTVWGANYTLGASTVDIAAVLGTADELHFGADVNIFNKDNTVVGNTTTQMDIGAYVTLALTPEKFGATGFDDCTLFTDVDSQQYFPERLPQGITGRYLIDRMNDLNPIDGDESLIREGSVLPLVLPGVDGQLTYAVLNATDTWQIRDTVSANLNTSTRFLCATVSEEDKSETSAVRALYNIPADLVTAVKKTADGGDVKSSRQAYVPTVLAPKSEATSTNVRPG